MLRLTQLPYTTIEQLQCVAVETNVEGVPQLYGVHLVVGDTDAVGICAVPLDKVFSEANIERVLKKMLRIHLPFCKTEERHAAQIVHGTLQHDAVTLGRVGKCRAIVATDKSKVGKHPCLSVVGQVELTRHELVQTYTFPIFTCQHAIHTYTVTSTV